MRLVFGSPFCFIVFIGTSYLFPYLLDSSKCLDVTFKLLYLKCKNLLKLKLKITLFSEKNKLFYNGNASRTNITETLNTVET